MSTFHKILVFSEQERKRACHKIVAMLDPPILLILKPQDPVRFNTNQIYRVRVHYFAAFASSFIALNFFNSVCIFALSSLYSGSLLSSASRLTLRALISTPS